MSQAELAIIIRARDEATAVLNKVSGSAQSLGSKLGTALKVGGAVAAGGLGVAGVALVGFVKAAAEEQVGIERLQTALGNLDAAHRGSSAEVEKLVAQRERLAFSDDQIRDSLSLLIPATGDYEEAVRRQKIAMDVSRGTGLDLATTSRLLGKVNEESVNVFKRYGITLDKNATETEALAAVQAKFAGQSEAYANTAAGKWTIFGNQMQNIKESIGAALLPVVTELGTKLSDFLISHQADINAFAKTLGEKIPEAMAAIGDAIERAKPALAFIFENVKTGFETIRPGLEWVINNKVAMVVALTAIGIAAVLAFTPVTLPILAVVGALVGLMFVIGLVRNHWDDISAKTKEIWGEISDFMNEKLGFIVLIVTYQVETIKNYVTTAFNVIRDIVKIVMALLQGDWGEAWAGIKQLAVDLFEGMVTDILLKVGFLRDALGFAWRFIKVIAEGAWNELKEIAASVWGGIRDAIVEPVKTVIKWIDDLIEKIKKIPSPGDILGGIMSDIPGFASGVQSLRRGTLALVGEGGPELMFVPGGASIFTAAQTRAMTGRPAGGNGEQDAGGTVINNWHIYINENQMHGDAATGFAALGAQL